MVHHMVSRRGASHGKKQAKPDPTIGLDKKKTWVPRGGQGTLDNMVSHHFRDVRTDAKACYLEGRGAIYLDKYMGHGMVSR